MGGGYKEKWNSVLPIEHTLNAQYAVFYQILHLSSPMLCCKCTPISCAALGSNQNGLLSSKEWKHEGMKSQPFWTWKRGDTISKFLQSYKIFFVNFCWVNSCNGYDFCHTNMLLNNPDKNWLIKEVRAKCLYCMLFPLLPWIFLEPLWGWGSEGLRNMLQCFHTSERSCHALMEKKKEPSFPMILLHSKRNRKYL